MSRKSSSSSSGAASSNASSSRPSWDVSFFGHGPSVVLPVGPQSPRHVAPPGGQRHTESRSLTQLLLGAKIDALNWLALSHHNVRVVINLVPGIVGQVHEHAMDYHCFEIDDDEEQEISWLFDVCFEIIDEQLTRPKKNAGAVFVHCAGGISRSASICIAYCMRKHAWTYDEAIMHVHSCRKIICPNDGFVAQLRTYEQQLRDIGVLPPSVGADADSAASTPAPAAASCEH